jgi:hypothetical protein
MMIEWGAKDVTSSCQICRLFSAFSNIFSKYFKPLEPVKAEHIVTGVGASPM